MSCASPCQEARAFLERCSIDIFIVTHRPSTFNLGVRMFAGSLERIHDKKMRFAAEHGTLSLDEVLGQQHESFRDMLLREIAARGMTNAACYQKAHVSKSVFSNIVKNGTIPKKPNVAALVFALELPLEDALTLFSKAGYYLTNTDPVRHHSGILHRAGKLRPLCAQRGAVSARADAALELSRLPDGKDVVY